MLSVLILLFGFTTIYAQIENSNLKYKKGDPVFEIVDKMPTLPGCENIRGLQAQSKCSNEKLYDYIFTHFTFSKEAISKRVNGQAIVQILVQKDGTIYDVECIQDPGAGIGFAAVNIIKSMNDDNVVWSPGTKKGKAEHVLITVPILFSKTYIDGRKKNVNEQVYIPEDAFEINTNDALSFPPPPPPPSQPATEEEVFRVVEQMPRFPGCEDQGLNSKELKDCSNEKMVRYIYQNLKYPKAARKNGTQGKAILQFIIEKNGKLSDVKLLRDPGDGCGSAAKMVMDQMSNEKTWTPGIQRGRPVKVLYTLPIDFKL